MKATPVLNGNGAAPATAVARLPTRKPAKLPTASCGAVQPATLMQAIIAASNNPATDVGKIAALVQLHQQMQARDWEQRFPGCDESIFAALSNVAPSFLMDRTLFNFNALRAATQAEKTELTPPITDSNS